MLRKFVRTSPVLEVWIGGRCIETTSEHPFFVVGRAVQQSGEENLTGWLPAAWLRAGDVLISHEGKHATVERVVDTRRVITVYNLQVEDAHTYFVGGSDWGFSVWAHNTYEGRTVAERRAEEAKMVSALQHFGVSEANAKAIAKCYRQSVGKNGSEVQLEALIQSGAEARGPLPIQPNMKKITKSGWEPTVHVNPETGAVTISVPPVQGAVRPGQGPSPQSPHILAEGQAMIRSGEYLFVVGEHPLARSLGDSSLHNVTRGPGGMAEALGAKKTDLTGILYSGDVRLVEVASPTQLQGQSGHAEFTRKIDLLRGDLGNRYAPRVVRVVPIYPTY